MLVAIPAALLGALTWSFFEYVIHRWAGHGPRAQRNLFGKEHVRHHAEGNYFAPSWKKGAAAGVALALLAAPAIRIAGPVAGGAWLGGFVGFYLTYEWLHRRAHTHAPKTAYGAWLRKHHFRHHYTDVKRNHGVTSPLWDVVWGTLRPESEGDEPIRVPRKLVMPWLLDPGTGELLERWRRDYVLRG